MSKPLVIDRPPRIQPELPFDEIEIPSPPDKGQSGWEQLAQMALPLVTILAFVFLASGGGGRSALMIIPMALAVLASAGIGIFTYLRQKRMAAEALRAYEERLVELNKQMHVYHDMQRRFYHYNYPEIQNIFRLVKSARTEVEKADRTLRADTRLWERRTSDEDFGVIRLGIGALPSTVVFRFNKSDDLNDPQVRQALKLEQDSRFVDDIPVIISLRRPFQGDQPGQEEPESEREKQADEARAAMTPTTHALGIAGDRSAVYETVRALLTHFAVFHAPMDARLFVLAKHKQEWAWTDQLQHCQSDVETEYRFFLDQVQPDQDDKPFDEADESPLVRYLEGLRRILATRKIQLESREDQEGKGDPTLPFQLVVVDLLDSTYDEESPLYDLESDAAISILIEQGEALGAAVIFLVPERAKVPSGCQSVIEVERTTPAINSRSRGQQSQRDGARKLHFRYAEVGVNSFRYVGVADAVPNPAHMEALARELAQYEVRQGPGAGLVSAVPFLDLHGFRSLIDLQTDVVQKWQQSQLPRNAGWLRCKIGRMAGGKARALVFSAKRDGVHGMVAGSTGSGKSELLISLIAGMAITYDPSVLNFVLVDYKGGGAFKEFEDLPHCVDIITNLEGDAVTRMFTAITAEMKRRQKLNADTGTKNIVEYRQRGLHESHYPYPYLFIIIDEFAEMIADRAEYKTELESITRVGRAQGVSLILAAQRPSGVTDQMRSNIKFRICLRVETPGESREMLRRTDAAFLPPGIPGRGYLQVGNEEVELLQVAYTGEKYLDPSLAPAPSVTWLKRPSASEAVLDQEPPELYKVLITTLQQQAREQACALQYAPWPAFLPKQLNLEQTLIDADPTKPALTAARFLADVDQITLGQPAEGPALTLNPALAHWRSGECGWVDPIDWARYAMRPVVGLVDNPHAARQLPLTLDLPRGHVVIFGGSGWGKTTFLRTLAVSLTTTHSPNALHMYLLDLGGRNLAALASLPHVGAVVNPDEAGYEERVEQVLRQLEDEVEARKVTLADAGAPDIYKYNQAHPTAPLPAILLAIDNFVEFKETFGGDPQAEGVQTAMDKFVALARQAKPYGVHCVITVNQLNAMPVQLFNLFTERLTLKLGDATEYRQIVGGFVGDLPDVSGRGYVKVGMQPLSFQIATPLDLHRVALQEPANEAKDLQRLGQAMNDHIANSDQPYRMPARVDALPRSILFKQILARKYGLELDENFLARLKQVTQEQWSKSADPDLADWLRVIIGVVSGNRLREMHLEAKADGVHGLIAGGTGAGKSELLMTLIVGLALNYDPSILNFVLVDYKGGGAFAPFTNLPHCVDTITNLNKAAVRRMFTAINAEMDRRMKLAVDAGVSNIVEYRAKGYHLSREPFPHLFIIIDEYAEMISESPEFKDELDRITRVGRSIGVNLLLAAQRPVGVTDQMRANIKYRICLRVEAVDTSREMLRRSDAAFLPNGMPGRGYMQVGNENIELIQVAYTGENYPYAEPLEGGRQPKFYDVIVDLCNDLLAETQAPRPRTPWPPFLPTQMTLSEPLSDGYLDPAYRPLITLGQALPGPLLLNPWTQRWLDGVGQWPGVNWSSTAMRGIAGLLDDPYNARQMPLLVDFSKGHAVLFGASGYGKTAFVRALIASLASSHSPDEFQAHVLDLGGRNLEVLTALPHVGTVILPDEAGYEERVQQLLRELNDVIDLRKRKFAEAGVSTLFEYNSLGDRPIEPAILLVVDNFAEFLETFGSPNDAEDETNALFAFVALARQAKAFGLHVLITANRFNVLSNKLFSLFTERFTLRLSDAGDYAAIVGSTYEVEELPGRGAVRVGRMPLSFQTALLPGTVQEGQVRGEAQVMRRLGQRMQEGVTASGRSYAKPLRIDALPKSSSYRQVLTDLHGLDPQRPFLEELERSTAAVWARNASQEHADWLRVTLGIASGMRQRTLALEAKRDGVHGLIAGGTGSGKSEMLMTMIVGLALNYSPDILNFVLVDYKGGGAFKPFEHLPHCVDIVTNLNKSAVARMFSAITAEMMRRQKLNADTKTKDIIEYRRKGLHLTHTPFPHLFIIIDEYAEMIDDNPDYKAELESITRVGRSIGVNLVLASQRPKGVTDQMRANIKLRLCLRVEETDTSRELLRKPDAAYLPNGVPGRGYLQIGNDTMELLQVSYTGEAQPDDRERAVLWPQRGDGVADQAAASGDVPKLYDAVVSLASELRQGQMAPKPWPAFLPQQISLQSPIVDAQRNRTWTLTHQVSDWLNGDAEHLWPGVDWASSAMHCVAGLVDNPMAAQQFPLQLDLTHHLAVLGDSGWGKTSMLRTLITALAATHSPDELHIYVADLGGHNYRSIEDFPHVGTVVYADEEAYEERLQRLLAMLDRLVDERSQLLGEAAANTLWEYNTRHPDRAVPAVLVVIDNFADLTENYETLVESTIMPLVRRSASAGVCFVVSANAPNNLPSKLYALFGERITFKQSNTDRLLDIVGRGALEIDDIPGRGYVRIGKRPLLFQAALPVGVFDGDDGRDALVEADEVRLMGEHMAAHLAADRHAWRHRPDPIAILPSSVALIDLLRAGADAVQAADGEPSHDFLPADGGSQRIQATLGTLDNLQPAICDLETLGPHFAIVGPPLSGKTTAMLDWILSLAERYPPEQAKMVLIDTQRKLMEYGGQHSLSDLPHVVAAVSEIEELEALIANLMAEGATLAASQAGRELFVFIDNFDDFSEEIESQRGLLESMSRLVRRYQRAGLHFVVAFGPEASTSDLRRRVLAANYGLGLQTAQAVDVLKVSRTPAGVRDKSLPAGRGYLVKSGQPVLIQVASPYENMVDSAELSPWSRGDDLAREAERVVKGLDAWVERISARYGAAKATWASADAVAEPSRAGQPSAKAQQMLGLVQQALRVEAQQMRLGMAANGGAALMDNLLAIDVARWQDEETLIGLMKSIWRTYLLHSGFDEMGADLFIGTSDLPSVLSEVTRELANAQEALEARQTAEAGLAATGGMPIQSAPEQALSPEAPVRAAAVETETAQGAIAEQATTQEIEP
jgi:S-DNA-T family DNA segregation ATPase FtsK/SpoIIIE